MKPHLISCILLVSSFAVFSQINQHSINITNKSSFGNWTVSGIQLQVPNNDYNVIRGWNGTQLLGSIYFFDDNWGSGLSNNSAGTINIAAEKGISLGTWNNAIAYFNMSNKFVGIGTTNPVAKVHINGIERNVLRVYKDGNTTNYLSIWQGGGGAAIDPIGTGKLWIGYDQPTNTLIGVNGGGAITSGKLGLGTISPQSRIHINSDVERESFRIYKDGNTTNYLSIWQGGGGAAIDPIGTGKLWIGYDQPTNTLIGVNSGGTITPGKLGLGTISPQSKIHINSSVERESFRIYKDGNTTNYLSIWQGIGGAALDPIGTGQMWIGYDQPTDLLIGVNPDGTVSSGKLGIGTNSPDAKLTVKGDIHAQEVLVDLNGAIAPDYVFEEDYSLRSLEDVESYISNYKHLPEIPSATEMEENGFELKEMNLKLLQKVEELTLYLIDLNQKVEDQNIQLQQLTLKNSNLRSTLSQLQENK